jgi:hypothetical protein
VESTNAPPGKAGNEMMLPDIYLPFFLTHVGNLNTVKLNQRRFAPTSAHIAGIKCPHHWNTQSVWNARDFT